MPIRARRDRLLGDSFDTVLAHARRGDPDAWRRIHGALAGRVAGYLRTQGAESPEDLTSEVFVAVVRNLETFSGDESQFRSWVFVIAHRRLQDERRRRLRRDVQLLAEVPDNVWADDASADAERSMGAARVRELCEMLAPDQRDVLLLRLVADLTVDQVAAVLGKSSGAVKALQRRGLASLSRLTERQGVTL